MNVLDVVSIHFSIPDDPNALMNIHTHGLRDFGHPEFQVLSPPILRFAAADLLISLAHDVINTKYRYQVGERCELDGFGVFQLEAGSEGTLRAVAPMPECEECRKAKKHKKREGGQDESHHEAG